MQHSDGSIGLIRDIREYASEWGWHKSWFRARVLILHIPHKELPTGRVVAEMSPHFLAALADDFLAARVYFDGAATKPFQLALAKIPFDAQAVGLEIKCYAEERKAELFRGDTLLDTVSW